MGELLSAGFVNVAVRYRRLDRGTGKRTALTSLLRWEVTGFNHKA